MTTTWIALLRGMNVGGHRITNTDLQAAFVALGFTDVGTWRASGNVFFAADGDEATLAAHIEQGLHAALGYAVPTFLRSVDELAAVAGAEPFTAAEQARSTGKIQVTFLPAVPDAEARDAVLAHASDDDRLALTGRELYWLPAAGLLDSDLDHKAIASHVGVGTTRTLGTVKGIAKKLRH